MSALRRRARPDPTKGDIVGNGVKVVGASDARRHDEVDDEVVEAEVVEHRAEERPPRPTKPIGPGRAAQGRAGRLALAVIAVAGIAGTIVFERAWSNLNAQQAMAAQARSVATTFLSDLTNFNAKTVDSDFARLTRMATGSFATQANRFFNSSIRQQLETALASSRGQIRDMYVQQVAGNQAQVYAVIDQLYVNRTLSAPQSDVLRVVVELVDKAPTWKISDVTVLEGPSLSSPSPSPGG